MKRNYITILFILLNLAVADAQSIVTNGLNLHLDAATGFTNTGAGAVWNDLSGAGNNMKAISVGNSPIQSVNAAGTPFTGIYFDGVDDYMFDSLGVNFNTKSATYFIVRIGNTLLNSTDIVYRRIFRFGFFNYPNLEGRQRFHFHRLTGFRKKARRTLHISRKIRS